MYILTAYFKRYSDAMNNKNPRVFQKKIKWKS